MTGDDQKKSAELKIGDVANLNGEQGLVTATDRHHLAGFCGKGITTITIEFVEYFDEEKKP